VGFWIDHTFNQRSSPPFVYEPINLVTFIFRAENISQGLCITSATSYGDIMASTFHQFDLVVKADGIIGAGHGTSFVFFCLFGTIYSTYASAWVGFSVFCGDQRLTAGC
jgi:hypothetical protein